VVATRNNFLQTLNKAWEVLCHSMKFISLILPCVDGLYVKQIDVDNFHNLGLILFRDKVSELLILFQR
jgi:hypothetical protein